MSDLYQSYPGDTESLVIVRSGKASLNGQQALSRSLDQETESCQGQ